MVRRVLVALALVASGLATAAPAAQAAPASLLCPATDGVDAGVVVASSDTPVTVSVRSTSTGATVPVTVTFVDDGTGFTLTSPSTSSQDEIRDASWCARAAKGNTLPVMGTGTTGTSPASTKKGELLRLEAVTVYSVTTPPVLVVCLDSSVALTPDLAPVRSTDGRDNLAVFDSTDGTCSLPTSLRRTMVVASSSTDADAACAALGLSGVAATLASFGYPVADSAWLCAAAD